MLLEIIKVIDIVIFIICGFNILYLLVFSVFSLFPRRKRKINSQVCHKEQKIVFLIPAYKEDTVILGSVLSCQAQTYAKENYDVVVISDQMCETVNQTLESMKVKLIIANFENSTKTKALNLAFSQLPSNYYDIAIILDADNIVPPHFLSKINTAFSEGHADMYQAHRVAKNKNTEISYMDAISEEINNSIFRLGHVNLGLSSALIGSGMAFKYSIIRDELADMQSVGGFDRELELRFFQKKYKIEYLKDLLLYDEKIQSFAAFSNQRRRWMSAQTHYLGRFFRYLPSELKKGNWDFCDKLLQHLLLPRLILLGVIFLMMLFIPILSLSMGIKWCGLFVLAVVLFTIAIPRNLYSMKMITSLLKLPQTFFIMIRNVFKLKGSNTRFIHTSHGLKEEEL